MNAILEKKKERPGREIKISNSFFNNENVTVKIGTADDKNSPKTVFISITFWVDIKDRGDEDDNGFDHKISREYSRQLNSLYKKDLRDILSESKYFPYYYENIFIYDFPENLNYNKKRSFTSIELNLHTINCQNNTKSSLPLKNKNNSELFDELILITKKIVNTDLLKGKLNFSIHKKK